VGFSRKRTGMEGKPRHTAYYIDVRGKERSAGTYPSKKAADKAWQAAEARLAEGRLGDPRRGRQLFQRYVQETWLPNHVMEPSTREVYTYLVYKHLLPWFGPMKMAEVLPGHVREWITHLKQTGAAPASISKLRFILSAIFTTAFDDRITMLHPCKGIKTPTVAIKPLAIITPEQFDTFYALLPDADIQLLIETDIETGLRWGELTELRVTDLQIATRMLTISRAVVQVNPKFHPEGKRFYVKEYPKDGEFRRFKISIQLAKKIGAHIKAEALTNDDLLFEMRSKDVPEPRLRLVPGPNELGLTPPNDAGKQYKHGTLSGYNAGKCHCDHCKDAFAIYRSSRRAAGKERATTRKEPRTVDTDGHIPRDWFRNQVWTPARDAAQLGIRLRVHDLRHAHASWLLAGGADLQAVKERMGHGSIRTTERYLHTLEDMDETTLDAFDAIRNRRSPTGRLRVQGEL
jgi:integrase